MRCSMRKVYIISDIAVCFNFKQKAMIERSKSFESKIHSKTIPELYIQEDVIHMKEKYYHLDIAQCEVILSAQKFFEYALLFDHILLHGTVLKIKSKCIMVLAPADGGKSTHLRLWKKFMKNKVSVISEDRPVLGKKDGVMGVWNSPWCKETDVENTEFNRLDLIILLKKSRENKIICGNLDDVISFVLEYLPTEVNKKSLSNLLYELLYGLDVWHLKNNAEIQCIKLLYDKLFGDSNVV